VVVTFNIAVMLNDRVDTSSEFLSDGVLNGGLILANIVAPLAVVAHEALKDHQQSKPEGMAAFENPVVFEDESSSVDVAQTEMEFDNPVTAAVNESPA
jgi:hypothetical protein